MERFFYDTAEEMLQNMIKEDPAYELPVDMSIQLIEFLATIVPIDEDGTRDTLLIILALTHAMGVHIGLMQTERELEPDDKSIARICDEIKEMLLQFSIYNRDQYLIQQSQKKVSN